MAFSIVFKCFHYKLNVFGSFFTCSESSSWLFGSARHIFDRANRSVGVGVDYRTRYVDLTSYYFKYPDSLH